jgi:hypothetical protein
MIKTSTVNIFILKCYQNWSSILSLTYYFLLEIIILEIMRINSSTICFKELLAG